MLSPGPEMFTISVSTAGVFPAGAYPTRISGTSMRMPMMVAARLALAVAGPNE